jgi:hypothetical protein
VRNIWSTTSYVFKSTASGVNIYNTSTELLTHRIVWLDGTSAVWADNDYLYFGTTSSGIYRIATTSISGSFDLTSYIGLYKAHPDITSNNINYLHGGGSYICVTTDSGVDHFKLNAPHNRIYTIVSGTGKCYQTTTGRFYYVLADSLNVMYDNSSNWVTPDYSYNVGAGIVPAGISINDVYITEGTSQYSGTDNVIFIATTAGAVVIEERKNDELNSRFKYYYLK